MNADDMSKSRCPWSLSDEDMLRYHDTEWGVPVRAPRALFERLILEGMQAGLSWRTILVKRPHMTRVFHAFDPERLAVADGDDLAGWLADPGVIRHRGKLTAMVDNARHFLELPDPGAFLWSFVDGAPIQNRWREGAAVPSKTPASVAMSKALRQRGFRFVGPTICYAFMQSAGLVNDHVVDCFRHEEVARLAVEWEIPVATASVASP